MKKSFFAGSRCGCGCGCPAEPQNKPVSAKQRHKTRLSASSSQLLPPQSTPCSIFSAARILFLHLLSTTLLLNYAFFVHNDPLLALWDVYTLYSTCLVACSTIGRPPPRSPALVTLCFFSSDLYIITLWQQYLYLPHHKHLLICRLADHPWPMFLMPPTPLTDQASYPLNDPGPSALPRSTSHMASPCRRSMLLMGWTRIHAPRLVPRCSPPEQTRRSFRDGPTIRSLALSRENWWL